jgi:hypothetical protein
MQISHVIHGHLERDRVPPRVVLLDHNVVLCELLEPRWHLGLRGVALPICGNEPHEFTFQLLLECWVSFFHSREQ